jgi:valyl-tRNA synthetase
MQWFLKMERLAQPALEAVADDTIRFYPAKFRTTYRLWLENIRDWCISRQLWWGHRIPAWYLPSGEVVVAETEEGALKLAREKTGNPALTLSDLRQDEDCLDTWFSSWLWPVSVFDGIRHPHNPDLEYYYPTNDLVTAPEIIFFWVARMIMSGFEYRRQPCFYNVYFTGIVRDKLGRKMSKSLGNSPDPIELMNRYGADGVRMGLLLASPAGNDLPFDESLCEQGRNFNNKIWNAFRLVKGWRTDEQLPQPEAAAVAVTWFRLRLDKTLAEINDCFAKYRLSEAMMAVYKLFRDEFSSWYLELVKPAYGQPADALTHRATVRFFDTLLRLLHPFMPFITEELWQALAPRAAGETVMLAPLPAPETSDAEEAEAYLEAFDRAREVIGHVRNVRLQKNLPNREALTLEVVTADARDGRMDAVILKMANLSEIRSTADKSDGAASFLTGTTEYAVPLGAAHVRADDEIARMEAELRYQKGFLASVMKKIGNERFLANAKAEVVENERRKQADAESKIKTLQEGLKLLNVSSNPEIVN